LRKNKIGFVELEEKPIDAKKTLTMHLLVSQQKIRWERGEIPIPTDMP
jgi:hypothetical protein